MTDKAFLVSMSTIDDLIDHSPEECGQCGHQFIMAEVARELLAKDETEGGIGRWSEEIRARWEHSKYYKLWQEEVAAGRDPHEAFEARGWEP